MTPDPLKVTRYGTRHIDDYPSRAVAGAFLLAADVLAAIEHILEADEDYVRARLREYRENLRR